MKGLTKVLGVLVLLAGVAVFAGKPALEDWMMSVPSTPFEKTPVPEAPDYSKPEYWSALPDQSDSADWLPDGTPYQDGQATAEADVFFVHPTAAFYGDYWVAGFDNLLHRVAVDYGIVSQHVTAFNGVAKIYAPRYRSVRMPIWWAEDQQSMHKATDLAYQDVKQAFMHYMEHWNQGRPFFIVSHSQGTLHTIRLLREEFDGKPLGEQMIAGYLIGNTIPDVPWFENIQLCNEPGQSGCFVTWNTIIRGGDAYHWVQEKGLDSTYCVNPLSWRADTVKVDKSENPGSIRMAGIGVVRGSLGPLDKQVVGAQCGEEGILWIDNVPEPPGYSAALFEGGSYHTYDINLYWDSIRSNAGMQLDSWKGLHGESGQN